MVNVKSSIKTAIVGKLCFNANLLEGGAEVHFMSFLDKDDLYFKYILIHLYLLPIITCSILFSILDIDDLYLIFHKTVNKNHHKLALDREQNI